MRYFSERCAVAIEICLSWQITLEKSGGGFFPLHRFESAHTAFLIIVRRFCLANNLQKEFHQTRFTRETGSKSLVIFMVIRRFRKESCYILNQGRQNVAVYDKVSAFCAISCYVSQGPHCLRGKEMIQLSQ